MNKITEAQFQSQVIEQAQLFGWLAYHPRKSVNQNGKWSTPLQGDPGFPDVVFAHPEKGTFFVEFKSEKGRLSENQKRWGDVLSSSGAAWFCWRPSDSAMIDLVLKEGVSLAMRLDTKNSDAASFAYWHAVDVIGGRWPEAEDVIAQHPEWAYRYALEVIKGRWLEAEDVIATDPYWAYHYARHVIKGRWPEAEDVIATHPYWANGYDTEFGTRIGDSL